MLLQRNFYDDESQLNLYLFLLAYVLVFQEDIPVFEKLGYDNEIIRKKVIYIFKRTFDCTYNSFFSMTSLQVRQIFSSVFSNIYYCLSNVFIHISHFIYLWNIALNIWHFLFMARLGLYAKCILSAYKLIFRKDKIKYCIFWILICLYFLDNVYNHPSIAVNYKTEYFSSILLCLSLSTS